MSHTTHTLQLASQLLAKGADVNAKTYDTQMSPLHLALLEANPQMVELLYHVRT